MPGGNRNRHAGLEHGHLNLLVSENAEMFRTMLIGIGLNIDDTGMITGKDGEQIICSSCGKVLSLVDIGYAMPPDYFYCDDEICICDYFERYGWPEHINNVFIKESNFINDHISAQM